MNLFTNARTKLTIYYLAIIMAISMFFSLIIYHGATYELTRIERMQRLRRPGISFLIDPEIITETKSRVFLTLMSLNAIILAASCISGYFLAGKTLNPISEMMDDQKDFVSNASHELRTPLTSLKSEIEVALRNSGLSLVDTKKLLRSNLEEVNRMTNLSNYLLKLNRYQEGSFSIEFKDVDLAQIVKKAVGKRKVKLVLEKTIVFGNENSLFELTSILLDNAFKYSKDEKSIEVKVANINKTKILEVTDRGIGILESDLSHIFDRFFRSDKARNKDGFGLGLSIAKQIAQMHDASIKVFSKPGIGSTFKVIFS